LNNTSQKAEEKSVKRKYLPVESNRCVGGVAAGENFNECWKQCGSDDWLKCRVVLGIKNPAQMERGKRDLCANHFCNLTNNPCLRLQYKCNVTATLHESVCISFTFCYSAKIFILICCVQETLW